MRLRAPIMLNGKTATGVQVPDEVVAGLGPSRRPRVRVTIAGHTDRSSVASMGGVFMGGVFMGGVFMLGISAENRASAGDAAGDEVDVDTELDTEPREVTVPPDLADALDADADARRVFDALSYSHQLRHVLSIEGAKSMQTRQRRIATTIGMLREARA